jgi:hypothetical protein
MQAQRTGKSFLLLFFKKRRIFFLERKKQRTFTYVSRPPRHDFGGGTG